MPSLQGEPHPSAKLTDDAVRAIRASYSPGLISQRDLAELFGVTQQMIARILTGRAWAHVS